MTNFLRNKIKQVDWVDKKLNWHEVDQTNKKSLIINTHTHESLTIHL